MGVFISLMDVVECLPTAKRDLVCILDDKRDEDVFMVTVAVTQPSRKLGHFSKITGEMEKFRGINLV